MTKRVLVSKRHIPLREKLELYSEKIPFSGCAIWTRTTNGTGKYGRGGYPIISLNEKGKQEYAHRLAYELYFGPVPKGMMVCHRCDVRACVNPNHLFVSDAKGNSEDRDRKGRAYSPGSKGERNGKAKLTTEDILTIRRKREAGMSTKEIAEEYGIGVGYAWRIWARRTWRHIP